jgi:hypothetical protein
MEFNGNFVASVMIIYICTLGLLSHYFPEGIYGRNAGGGGGEAL